MGAIYFAIRHGESVPSSASRICSSMAAGVDPRNGLTAVGREQVNSLARQWIASHRATIERHARQQRLVLLSSPFSRARETAEIIADVLDAEVSGGSAASPAAWRTRIELVPDLRERNFGSFEGQRHSDLIYARVWKQDQRDPSHTLWGVESAQAVQDRVLRVVAGLEAQAQGMGGPLGLLVSHGDTLKILQAGFQRQGPAAHADPTRVQPFRTGEIRALSFMPP